MKKSFKRLSAFLIALVLVFGGAQADFCLPQAFAASSSEKQASASIKLSSSSFVYDGKVKKPKVTVKGADGKKLKERTDYTLKFSNASSENIGKYCVKVTLKGKYSGKKTLTYYIRPGVTSKIAAKQTASSVTITWKAVKGAAKYRVYLYNAKSGKYEKLADTNKLTYTAKKLNSGTKYKLAVKAFKTVDGKNFFAEKQKAVNFVTKPGTPTLKVKAGAKKATLSWNRQSCSGYEIYVKTVGGEYKKLTCLSGASKLSYTAGKLAPGQTYSFKVRAYKTVGEDKIYSAFSPARQVKIEKELLQTVYVTPTGKKFHRPDCPTIKNKRALSRSEAVSCGYEPCKVCKP